MRENLHTLWGPPRVAARPEAGATRVQVLVELFAGAERVRLRVQARLVIAGSCNFRLGPKQSAFI